MNVNYLSQKMDWKKYNWSNSLILQEVKLYSSVNTFWQLSYTCFKVFGALGQFAVTEPKWPKGAGVHSLINVNLAQKMSSV